MRLRRATPADGPAIASVHLPSWRTIYKGVLEDSVLDELDEATLARDWSEAIEEPDTPDDRVWILEDETRAVGYSRTGPNRDGDIEDPETFEIYGFYTHPDVWGTGAGTAMMAGVLDDFRSRGATAATLWVVEANPRARAFYAKQGWSHEPGPTNRCFGAPEVRYRISL